MYAPILAISGKAVNVFKTLRLLATMRGSVTLKELNKPDKEFDFDVKREIDIARNGDDGEERVWGG